MAIENVSNFILPEEMISQLVTLTRFFQAVGGLILAYIIFGVLNAVWNRRKSHEITKMRKLLEQINKKLDTAVTKKKK